MSYTPMGDLGQQGLFDITRILLQQPDLAALSETLTGLVQQSALADRAAIILWAFRQPSRRPARLRRRGTAGELRG